MNRFERLHALLSQKPRANLGFFPTPLYKLDRLSERLGVNLYVKRDDFSGMSLFGGNKIRKLEYLLGDAREKGCDTVFTYGATQSNHAMQTVTACRRLGMEPILYLNAYVQPDENDVRSNMLLDRILGAQVNVVPGLPGETEAQTEARCHQMGVAHAARLEAEGKPRRLGGVYRRLSGNDGAMRAVGHRPDAALRGDGHGRHAGRIGRRAQGAGRRAGDHRRGRQPQGRGLRRALRRAGECVA